MKTYEYKVVPAPRKGKRGKGVHGAEGKFANALMVLMNEHGAEGWEYLRTDTLPVESRSGLTGKTTVFQNMLIFRKLSGESESTSPAVPHVETPAAEAKVVDMTPVMSPEPPDLPDNITELEVPKDLSAREPAREAAAE